MINHLYGGSSQPQLYWFCVLQGAGLQDSLTFPAALGLAPLSRSISATSTFPYLEATWRGVKPFCSGEQKDEISQNVIAVYHITIQTIPGLNPDVINEL